MVYEETKDDIAPFLKLYRLSKAKGVVSTKLLIFLKLLTTKIYQLLKSDLKGLRNDISICITKYFFNVRVLAYNVAI
jgi:hypothetical protein